MFIQRCKSAERGIVRINIHYCSGTSIFMSVALFMHLRIRLCAMQNNISWSSQNHTEFHLSISTSSIKESFDSVK